MSHVGFEFLKEYNDSHFSIKLGDGSYNFSWMQTLSSKLMGGFEMLYAPHTKEVFFCYGGTYKNGIHKFFANYHPLAEKETLNIGYITKPSKHLTLFSEFKGNM
jgi:hypothetical protein